MRKYILLGFLPVLAIALAIYFWQMNLESKACDEVLENLTVFADIDELGFLAPYEVEKTDLQLPNHALKGYCAKISYEGNEYSVTALTFESEELAQMYLNSGIPHINGSTDYSMQGTDDYNMLRDYTKNVSIISACGGGNYYQISGNGRGEFLEFVKFMSSNMTAPVGQGGY